jgi:ABC-2 type transport system ATP-binding protein
MSIEVKEVSKNYGTQKAVQSVSFSVSAGSVVGFLGPNGAGKSTTLKMIAGYLTPDAGSIVVHGIDVVKDPIAAKKHIGYLAEANPLYFDMYVKEYLSFIGKAHTLTEVSNAVANCIELTGLGAESHKKIGQLSKGYKQRVGLAAALIHNPQVLLLDEPTSGLDPNQIIEIRNVIQVQGAVKTVLFSSHILQEVEAICERALILSKGQIVANDLLSNLLHNKSQSLESVFRSLTSGLETHIIT